YLKLLKDEKLNLDLYVIHNNEKNVLETFNYGFRLASKIGSFDAKTENVFQDHASFDRSEYTFNAEVGYKLGGTRLYAGYQLSSEEFDHLYTNRHLYNGIID